MTATVHVLHSRQPLAAFLRVGHTGQKWLEDQHARGRLPFRRFVFDAAHIGEQQQLLSVLKAAGSEIVLDPNVAELAALGKYAGAVSKLPWAHGERPWTPEDFGKGRNLNLAHQIAEFAVSFGVHAVLSPSHLEGQERPWRAHDLDMVSALRRSLDELGGHHIKIDYQLVSTAAALRDSDYRRFVIRDIAPLPVENVWLRVSGFDARVTGTGTRRFIECARDLHRLERPLIADMTGGFPALAASASGGIAGFSGGVAQKESFRSSEYLRIPTGTGGGAGARIYIRDLDRFVSEDQLTAILAARGARSRVLCTESECCPQGREDMIENSKSHFLFQRHKQVDDLSRVPDPRKFSHFLLNYLAPAVRNARSLARLRIDDQETVGMIQRERKRLILMNDVLGALYEGAPDASRSTPALFRGGGDALNILSRQL